MLGICRGMQLINVALGGSLFQDVPTQLPGAIMHEHESYDRNCHFVVCSEQGQMAQWFEGIAGGRVISIHHQAINRLGSDVEVEVHADDGVVEAIRWKGRSFVCGVQWHPEFHDQPKGEPQLDCSPLFEAFLGAVRN